MFSTFERHKTLWNRVRKLVALRIWHPTLQMNEESLFNCDDLNLFQSREYDLAPLRRAVPLAG